MIYGSAAEDVLTGFVIQSRGWKSAYCTPSRKAFLGGAPVNLNDTLVQNKRWSAGLLEAFLSKFCPYVYGIQRTRIAQRMCYGVFCLWAPSSLYILCYGLFPALFMLNGVSLFHKGIFFLINFSIFLLDKPRTNKIECHLGVHFCITDDYMYVVNE